MRSLRVDAPMEEQYKVAIDIIYDIAKGRVDPEALIREIAKEHPDVVVLCFNKMQETRKIDDKGLSLAFREEVLAMIRDSRKISAIKKVREVTGWG